MLGNAEVRGTSQDLESPFLNLHQVGEEDRRRVGEGSPDVMLYGSRAQTA